MYTDLVSDFHALRERTARFRRVALHLHSIDSHDWAHPAAADADRNAKDQFRETGGPSEFANHLREHLDLCAITDHMRCAYATRLSAETGTHDQFTVLPGMEVNFRAEAALSSLRIHLLVILPSGSTPEDFARIFEGQIHIPNDSQRTGQEDVTGISLSAFVERVHNNSGLCIAAHIDSDNGVRMRFRKTAKDTLRIFSEGTSEDEQEHGVGDQIKEYLYASKLDAIEVSKSADSAHYTWISDADGHKKWIPTVLTFDAHCVEHFARPDRISHLKMTDLGLQGLKDALRFPDTRIRFPDNLPDLPSPTLRGIRIAGDDNSFFEDLTVAFAENLNCVIGVRGSGKSTLIEALRYVFGYNRSLRELGPLADPVKALQQKNLPGSLIQLLYRTSDRDERILSATYDPKSDYVTKVYTPDGEYCEVPDVEASDDFPMRLFGWSEIETLGRNHQRQRDLLDRLIPELNSALEKKADVRHRLRVNRAEVDRAIAEVRSAFTANDTEIRRYSEFRQDFDKLNTEGVRHLFSELDHEKEKRQVLVKAHSNATSLHNDLQSEGRTWLQAGIDEMLASASPELRDWWVTEESQALQIAEIEASIKEHISAASQKAAQFSDLVQSHGRARKERIDELQANLERRLEGDNSMQRLTDLRANAEGRLKRVQELRRTYQDKWNELLRTLEQRFGIAQELKSVQDEIGGIRARHNERLERTLNRFLPGGMQVSIDLHPGADTRDYADWLYKIFGARSQQVKRIRQVLEENVAPTRFAEMIWKEELGHLVPLSDSISEENLLNEQDRETCVERTKVVEKDEGGDVSVLVEDGARLTALMDLQETEWDDREAILLNDVPVDQKSPGQRSSAMLPLIALAENTPLVIDQPEDNLDKRLVGTVLSNVLSELKEQRQIIVCTHDPNILVGGDAEQIVVLDAESERKGHVEQHGSIDNNDIIGTVVDLLEGGEDAFARRTKRYGGRV